MAGLLAAQAPPAAAAHLAGGGWHLGAARQVSGGWLHTCALDDSGRVFCWGANTTGQLGDGTAGAPRSVPRRVDGISGAVRQISAGAEHTCALTGSGDVWCWGSNTAGQSGPDADAVALAPVKVTAAVPFAAISAGGGHTCAVTTGGQAWCWGADSDGQLGRNAPFGENNLPPAPVYAADMGGVSSISAGANHTCAVSGAGRAWCWGLHDDGRLGTGASAPVFRPQPVLPGAEGLPTTAVAAISAATAHTCALTSAGAAYCWGDDRYGRLGDPSGGDTAVPSRVKAVHQSTGAVLTLTATSISAGLEHTCASGVRVNGGGAGQGEGAYCWGRAVFGQLGDGVVTAAQDAPKFPVRSTTALAEPTGAVLQLDAGYNHTCSRNAGDRAFCWGLNAVGQLGDATVGARKEPSPVFAPAL